MENRVLCIMQWNTKVLNILPNWVVWCTTLWHGTGIRWSLLWWRMAMGQIGRRPRSNTWPTHTLITLSFSFCNINLKTYMCWHICVGWPKLKGASCNWFDLAVLAAAYFQHIHLCNNNIKATPLIWPNWTDPQVVGRSLYKVVRSTLNSVYEHQIGHLTAPTRQIPP